MKSVTVECNGFVPKFPDNTTYKTTFEKIVIKGIKEQALGYLGWRQQWDDAPRIYCDACIGLNNFFYQSGYQRIDKHFWDGLPNVKYFQTGAWWGPDITEIYETTDWLEGAPKSLIKIDLSSQEGSPKKLTCKFIKPVAKQLKRFTASGYNLPQFENGFWKRFDWNNIKSLVFWPDNYKKTWHIQDDLIECLKTIPEDRVVFIEREKFGFIKHSRW